jgi:hypothetical protein
MYYNYRYYEHQDHTIQGYIQNIKSKFAAESVYKAAVTYGLLAPSGIRTLNLLELCEKLLDNYSDSDFTKQGSSILLRI